MVNSGRTASEDDKLFLQAEQLYRTGAYKQAFPMYMELASRGRRGCGRFVGWMYFAGEGVERNVPAAYAWFVNAANQGDIEASFGAGRSCLLMHRYEEALEWFAKGCAQDFPPACFRVGWMYQQGKGCKRNNALAYHHFQEAYKKGNLHAGRALAVMLARGTEGFSKRFYGAFLWLRLLIKVIVVAAKDPQSRSLMA
jgi:TPR repeat protein